MNRQAPKEIYKDYQVELIEAKRKYILDKHGIIELPIIIDDSKKHYKL